MARKQIGDIATGRLPPEALDRNFDDIAPPLDRQAALLAAQRCYYCYDAPCIQACPTGIDIPAFIKAISTDNLKGAAATILSANIMGGMCARVCPTEVLCEGVCVRVDDDHKPVEIGALQRYATDWVYRDDARLFERAGPTGRRIAVVGAGPAGLACAHALARLGHEITVFEARPKPGGLNEYGIAAYKVPGFPQREVEWLLSIGGIAVRHDMALGREVTLSRLRAEHDAVFLGVGLAGVNALGVDGEDFPGVRNAVEFIAELRQSPDKSTLSIGRRVVVIGGGNTAVDAAVQSKRLGAETVSLVYRRGPEHMSATAHEQAFAKENGVHVIHWAQPRRLLEAAGVLSAVEFEHTAPGAGGKAQGTGEYFALAADQVMKAIGQVLVPEVLNGGADANGNGAAAVLALRRGRIAVDEHYATSIEGVWAGGDCVGTQLDLTVQAVEDGKRAAAAMHRALTQS